MKVQKASRIGVVVADQVLRAAQRVDGRLVTSTVRLEGDLERALRQLLTSSPFVGREVVVGLEGSTVLIESLVVPPGATQSAQAACADRLKGDPVFNEENATLQVAVAPPPSGQGPSMVIAAAVVKARIAEVMAACRAQQLVVQAVEAAALASWRAWPAAGHEVRLLRGDENDTMLAGADGKLLFCRIVTSPISPMELRATVSRAASLLQTERFECLMTCGLDDVDMQLLERDLGQSVRGPEEALPDPAAVGLATPGAALAEFTPAEDIKRRESMKVRRVRFTMISAASALVAIAGVLGFQKITYLQSEHDRLAGEAQGRQVARAELESLSKKLERDRANEFKIADSRPGHRMSSLFALIVNSTTDAMLLDTVSVVDQAAEDEDVGDEESPRRLSIKLAGLAGSGDDVRHFTDNLLATSAFIDVRVDASERVLIGTGDEGERFRITARAETR